METICVIDDDEIYKLTFKNDLNKLGHFRILFFADGEMAINFFKNMVDNAAMLPDIVFLDINMPIMDGWDFIEEYIMLKPMLSKKIIIYMVSTSINPRDINRARYINEISDYIVKPISNTMLNNLLNLHT